MDNNYLTILYKKMKICVVKDYVETEIPGVDVDTDAAAEDAVKQYLEDNNLKKKSGSSIKATRGFGASKDRYTIQVVDKPASKSASAKSSTKKGGKRSKKTNKKRSRHSRR
jgi:hypothetical protein